jgi:toxin ParE1/3/4
MARTFVVEPEAEAEIGKIADWYNQRNPVARLGFFNAIDSAFDLIRRNPEQYQIVYREMLRALVDGYPYALFYTVNENQIVVVSCFHTSRDPAAWHERLR